jgi:hypothetical protein
MVVNGLGRVWWKRRGLAGSLQTEQPILNYTHPLVPCAYLLFCLNDILFSASTGHIKVVREGRVKDSSFMQGEGVSGKVEEHVRDEEIDRIGFFLGCDQLFGRQSNRLVPVVRAEERIGCTERM